MKNVFRLHSQITKFMGPTRGPHGSCRSHMGPMLASWPLLSGLSFRNTPVAQWQLISFPVEDKNPFILHNQYCIHWWLFASAGNQRPCYWRVLRNIPVSFTERLINCFCCYVTPLVRMDINHKLICKKYPPLNSWKHLGATQIWWKHYMNFHSSLILDWLCNTLVSSFDQGSWHLCLNSATSLDCSFGPEHGLLTAWGFMTISVTLRLQPIPMAIKLNCPWHIKTGSCETATFHNS